MALAILLPPLPQESLSPWRKECYINVSFRAEHPTVSYFLCLDELSVVVFITIYYDSAVNGMGATSYLPIVFKALFTH